MSKTLSITTPDGNFTAYMAEPASLPAPAIVVGHEVFGVNADLRTTCDELAAAGYIAVCPDLFWRMEPGVDLEFEKGWEHGLKLYMALDLDQAVKDVQTVIAQVKALPTCSGKVGMLGYCLGGLLTYLVSVRGGVDAAVEFHGARTEEFLGEAHNLHNPLLVHLGTADEFIPPAAQAAITSTLQPLGAEVCSYEGRYHAFTRHGGAHYDAAAAALANQRTRDFFKKYLFG